MRRFVIVGLAMALVAGCSHRAEVTQRQRMAVEAKILGQIDLPVYPGTATEGYVTNGRGGKVIRVLFLHTSDPISRVTDYYKARVPRNAKASILLQGDSGSVNFTFNRGKAEKQITLSTGSGYTEIELLSISRM